MKKALYALVILAFAFAGQLQAQVTTSSLSGKVKDAKGSSLPGVTVLAIHVPTGTQFGSVTDGDGSYQLNNLTAGGPYKITVSFVGFQEKSEENISLALGNDTRIDFALSETAQELQAVQVIGARGSTKTGAGSSFNESQISRLPSLGRSIQDVTRLTAQSSNNSFAGTNFRYNNVAVDGAVNNDAIGFSPSLGGQTNSSGMPGSSTRTNAISMDAIQDIQVAIAPFDIKIGNFLGGSINAVTRQGSNEVTGSVYAQGRNAALVGADNVNNTGAMPNTYEDYQAGFRVGFPIVKNKLFFFSNEEITHHQEPLFYNAGTQGALIDAPTAQRISDTLNKRYAGIGYSNGEYGDYAIHSNSTKFFNRLDWNIAKNHQLSIRNNYVVSDATNLERDAQNFRFSSIDYTQRNVQNSTVLELKSRFGNSWTNSFIAGFSDIHDYRQPSGKLSGGNYFPQVEIAANGGTILLGSDREASVFNMKQQTFEITDNVTWTKGKHNFTFGTHNELYNINYGFVNSLNGRIAYSSLANFYAQRPSRVRGSYLFNSDQTGIDATNNTPDYNFNNPSAVFNIDLFSLYAQDEIKITDRFKVIPGIRADLAYVPNSPQLATATTVSPTDPYAGTTYSATPLNQISNKLFGQPQISPRVGFNYDVMGNRKFIVRGGTGLFTGRIPFAWLGYAYYNNGVNYGAFDVKPNGTSNYSVDPLTNPYGFAATNGQKVRTQVDLIDNNFKMPQVWRSNLAADVRVGDGWKFTVEGLFTQVITDLKFQQVNLRDTVRYYSYDASHQMPIYISDFAHKNQTINSTFSNAYMLSNTSQGYRYSATVQAEKSFKFGLDVRAAYTYGESFDITNGIRNSMESNWQLNQSLTPNDPKLAYSNFDIRHRIVSSAAYRHEWSKFTTTTVTAIFTAQSGTPFTWGFVNSTLAGTPQTAGLAYIPTETEVTKYLNTDIKNSDGTVKTTAAQQQKDFNDYVNADSYLSTRRGQFTERNGGRTPWNINCDLRIAQDLNFSQKRKSQLQITLDIINVGNLLNPDWGRSYFVSNTFNSTSSVGLAKAGTIGGSGVDKYDPTYTFTKPTTLPYSVDVLGSRYQAQIGLRYNF